MAVKKESNRKVWVIMMVLSVLFMLWTVPLLTLSGGTTIIEHGLKYAGSQFVVTEPASGFAELERPDRLLVAGSIQAVWASFVFYSIGSLFSNFLFYKGKAIPGILAVFSLFAAALCALGSFTALIVDLPESANMVMMFPLVLFGWCWAFISLSLG